MDFVTDVKPILEMNCVACHNAEHAEENGKYRIDTKEEAFKPHKKDQRIVAGPSGRQRSLLSDGAAVDRRKPHAAVEIEQSAADQGGIRSHPPMDRRRRQLARRRHAQGGDEGRIRAATSSRSWNTAARCRTKPGTSCASGSRRARTGRRKSVSRRPRRRRARPLRRRARLISRAMSSRFSRKAVRCRTERRQR